MLTVYGRRASLPSGLASSILAGRLSNTLQFWGWGMMAKKSPSVQDNAYKRNIRKKK